MRVGRHFSVWTLDVKATLTLPSGDVLKYDDGWLTEVLSPQTELALQEAQKAFSDPRQQIDFLIEQYGVKVTDAVLPEPLPKGAIN